MSKTKTTNSTVSTVPEWGERDQLFKHQLYPRIAYMPKNDFQFEEVTLLSFGVDEKSGATMPACTCRNKDGRVFRCSSDMVYLTVESCKFDMVVNLREGIRSAQNLIAETAQSLIEHTRQLQLLEEDLKL